MTPSSDCGSGGAAVPVISSMIVCWVSPASLRIPHCLPREAGPRELARRHVHADGGRIGAGGAPGRDGGAGGAQDHGARWLRSAVVFSSATSRPAAIAPCCGWFQRTSVSSIVIAPVVQVHDRLEDQ